MEKGFFASASRYLIPLLILITPLFFLTSTLNIFAPPKQLFLIITTVILATCWLVDLLKTKELKILSSPISLPLALLVLAIMVNLGVEREARLEGLIGRGSLYLSGSVLAFLTAYTAKDGVTRRNVIYALIIASSLLALHGLLQLTWLNSLAGLPTFMASKNFSLSGSPLTNLTVILIGAVTTFMFATTKEAKNKEYYLFGLGVLQVIAAVAYISLMLPGGELALNLLPYPAAWSLALDALKSTKSLLFGVGLGNFSTLYTSAKPLFLNSSNFWNITPSASSSELLQLLSTTGLLGLGAFLLLPFAVRAGRGQENRLDRTMFATCIATCGALILTPASIPVIVIFFVTLGLLSNSVVKSISLGRSTALSFVFVEVCLLLTALYYSSRVYAADMHMKNAAVALSASDGKKVYEEHLAAIALMPSATEYRVSYSQVNLSLASALSQKSDLSDQDREQIATLVSQAIREAKVATALRPRDSRSWQNLGLIYRNLVNVAEGADQFAVESYGQAVALDPANAALRVDFGGLLYQLAGTAKEKATKDAILLRAIQEFQIAVQLKNDYANGYYNLAKALESAGNIQGAYAAMQKTVASLNPSSPDLQTATAELETLKSKLPAVTPTTAPQAEGTGRDISEPSPLPSPLDGGPIELEASPTPSPSL